MAAHPIYREFVQEIEEDQQILNGGNQQMQQKVMELSQQTI